MSIFFQVDFMFRTYFINPTHWCQYFLFFFMNITRKCLKNIRIYFIFQLVTIVTVLKFIYKFLIAQLTWLLPWKHFKNMFFSINVFFLLKKNTTLFNNIFYPRCAKLCTLFSIRSRKTIKMSFLHFYSLLPGQHDHISTNKYLLTFFTHRSLSNYKVWRKSVTMRGHLILILTYNWS